MAAGTRTVTTAVTSPVTRADVEEFLYAEAALLDDGDYEAWLELFTPDSVYWVPNGTNDLDPTRQVSLVYDTWTHLAERVRRFRGGIAYAQEPASRTAHAVTNVRIVGVEDAADGSGQVLQVDAVFSVAEFRRGSEQLHSGRYRYRLRVLADGGLGIQRKKVELINNDGFFGNLSLLL
jgi:3-phenylpropionate/cinnamic acid dioxygenase small subunit